MGTHGRGLFGRWFIGSITQGILRKVSIPILTVCRATGPIAFKRILFAADLSEASRQGFGFALELARMMRSDIVVLHALETVSLTYGGGEMVGYVSRQNMEEVRAKLDDLVAEGNRQNVKIETVLIEGIAAEEIVKAADDNTADLILIAVQRKGVVERTLLGTTAERVIREAHVPVLSIPANAAAPS
jgi:nucleotide-binding universal stress UspA family protein